MQEVIVGLHTTGAGTPDYFGSLTFDYTQQEDEWVGVCLELGTSSFGDSLVEAKSRLTEAVDLHLNEVERLGFHQEFLQEHTVTTHPIPPSEPVGKPGFTLVGAS